MKIGNIDIVDPKKGDIDINEIYRGDDLVWERSTEKFLYVAGQSTIKKYRLDDLYLVAESTLQYNIWELVSDGEYIYGNPAQSGWPIRKYNKDLSYANAQNYLSYNGRGATYLDGFIYAGGTNGMVRKIDPNNLSITHSLNFGGRVMNVDGFGDYIYVSSTDSAIKRYNKGDLSYTNVSSDELSGNNFQVIIDDYILAQNGGGLTKINLGDLSFTGINSPNLNLTIRGITRDGDYVYVSGFAFGDNRKIYRLNWSDFSIDLSSDVLADGSYPNTIYGDYLYVGFFGGNIIKYNKTDFTETGVSVKYGDGLRAQTFLIM